MSLTKVALQFQFPKPNRSGPDLLLKAHSCFKRRVEKPPTSITTHIEWHVHWESVNLAHYTN